MLNAARWGVVGLLAASIIALTFVIGYVIADSGGDSGGSRLNVGDRPGLDEGEVDFDTLNEIAELLGDRYVDPDRIDAQTLYESAINGMLQTLSDSGTYYVDPSTVRLSTSLSGTFEGIGATVSQQDGEIVIVSPIKDTPAERAGVQSGDVLLEVNGESAEGWTTEIAVLKIRGPKGTTVRLKLRHPDGQEQEYEIERDDIEVASVTTVPPGGVLEDGAGNQIDDIGYIYISEFSALTPGQFEAAMQEVLDSGARGLVLDMRNNLGGLLDETLAIADEFLESGTILTQRERDDSERSYRARRGGMATDIPVVVLLNRFSASGSEVLGAALQDNDRATIVGEKSFGKGTVNTSSDLDDGGQLYVSVAHWLTPDGSQIDGVGIRPDVPVALSDEDIDLRRDVQLFKAIDILRGTEFTPVTALTPQPEPSAEATQPAGG